MIASALLRPRRLRGKKHESYLVSFERDGESDGLQLLYSSIC